MQNGGLLGFLASLSIPLISSLIGSLMGKGLQVDRARRTSGWQACLQTYNTSPGASNTSPGVGLQIDSIPRMYKRMPISDFSKSQNF